MQDLLKTAAGPAWEKVGVYHHHGIVTPLFSLHTDLSCGIGEYLDLLPLFPWLKKCGFDTLQLLPLNDLGNDTSPYSAISAFALNPLLLSLAQLPFLRNSPVFESSTQRIDYKKVQDFKINFLKNYYQENFGRFSSSIEYLAFIENNSWLKPYALFKTLKHIQQWQSWTTWPEAWKELQPETFDALIDQHSDEIHFHYFLQFLCFEQMKTVKYFADESGIHLMGDIPILLNFESADVWFHRKIFNTDLSAGAPPDMFSADGQNWGFPLYNWESLADEDYRWWKQRLAYAEQFYKIFRLDHVVGFFRIWGIPPGLKGTDGQFYPSAIAEWQPKGEHILRMLQKSSSMLPIGEDLGVIPHEVRNCLRHLGICGTKVMRWERAWEQDSSFLDPKKYIPESLTTVSTHDSETLFQWWVEQPEEARLYAQSKGWPYENRLSEDLALQILNESHQSGSLFHINLLQEYLRIVPGLSWPYVNDERINLPGLLLEDNWTYRFRPSVEEIVKNNELSAIMTKLSSSS